MKILVYAAIGFLALVGVAVLALLLWTPGERRPEPESQSIHGAPTAQAVPTVNPEWPGAAFPSDAWRSSPLDWYIQWKRVHKYARIASQTSQPAGFAPLRDQARDLWENVVGWQSSRLRSACLAAAEQLHKAVSALADDAGDGPSLLRAAEPAGDKCRDAAQARIRGR